MVWFCHCKLSALHGVAGGRGGLEGIFLLKPLKPPEPKVCDDGHPSDPDQNNSEIHEPLKPQEPPATQLLNTHEIHEPLKP